VQIFDEVIDSSSVNHVDMQATAGQLGHTVMSRSNDNRGRTAVESAIDLCLRRLGDRSPYVEYWWREEWIDLEAHKDVDEVLAREEPGNLRYPCHGHVLYLDVGRLVCGPTVLLTENDGGICVSHKLEKEHATYNLHILSPSPR
jgi:hypothetical protein